MGGGIFIFPDGGASQQSILNRLSSLENETIKRGYYQVISGTSGTISLASGITFVQGQFGSSGNSILSQVNGSNYPIYNSPTDVSGNPVTSTLNTTTGAWTASATYVQATIAIFFVVTGTQINIDSFETAHPEYVRVIDIEDELVLNGLSGTIQNFSVGNSGTDFTISSAGLTHTFSIPDASATARGLLNSTDWSVFNNKQSLISNNLIHHQSIVNTDLLSDYWNQFNTGIVDAYPDFSATAGTYQNVVLNPNGNASGTQAGKYTFFNTALGFTSVTFSMAAKLPSGVGSSTVEMRIYNGLGTVVIGSQSVTLTSTLTTYTLTVTGLSANTQYLAAIVVHNGTTMIQQTVCISAISLIPNSPTAAILQGNYSFLKSDKRILHNNYNQDIINWAAAYWYYDYNINAAAESRIKFYTDATSLIIEAIPTTGNASWSKMAVYVNDKFYDVAIFTTSVNDYQYYTVTLPGGYNKVEIINGLTTGTVGRPKGTFLSKVFFNSNSRLDIIYPSNATGDIVVYGDSISVGGDTGNPMWGWQEAIMRIKGWNIVNYSRGSGALQNYNSVTNGTAQWAYQLCEGMPKIIVMLIGTNDYGLNAQSAAAFGPAYAELLDYIHQYSPKTRVLCITPLVRSTETANTFGNTLLDYRVQISNAVAVRNSWCTLLAGNGILTTSDLMDGLHPTPAGHFKLANSVITNINSILLTPLAIIKNTITTVADSNYTVLVTDSQISYTSLTVGRTVTLPTTGFLKTNQDFVIKDETGTAGTNNITISGTIDGAASIVINTNYGSKRVYWNGTSYFTK